MPIKLLTGVGRIVWGHPTKGRGKTDSQDKPVLGEDGKQVLQWSFGLAIGKNTPAAEALRAALGSEAASIYPQGTPANFAWKLRDGDGFDTDGKPNNVKEGWAGHWVLAISTEAFAPKVVQLQGGAYVEFPNVKTGDFVRVEIDIKAHQGKAGTRGSVPGLYINPTIIEFIAYGAEISNGPDAMATFGGQQVGALPPGASLVPLAPSSTPVAPGAVPGGMNPAGMPGGPSYPSPSPTAYPSSGMPGGMPGQAPAAPMAMPGQMPGYAPAPAPVAVPPGYAAPAAPMPGQPVQPHTAFVANAAGQPVPPGYAAPAAPVPPGYAPAPAAPAPVALPPRWVQDANGFYDANIGPHARYTG